MAAKREISGWAFGWTLFAAVWMWILGSFHFLAGIAGIANDDILVVTPDYVVSLNTTTWGWIQLILGGVVWLAGFGLFSGSVWARTIGVVLAGLSILANFAWLPYQPLWAILMMAAGAFVIWALTVHGGELAR